MFILCFNSLVHELYENLQFRFYRTVHIVHSLIKVLHYRLLIVFKVNDIPAQNIGAQMKVLLYEMLTYLVTKYQEKITQTSDKNMR